MPEDQLKISISGQTGSRNVLLIFQRKGPAPGDPGVFRPAYHRKGDDRIPDAAVQYGKSSKPVIARYYANTADGLEKALLGLGWKGELDARIDKAYRKHVRHGLEAYASAEKFIELLAPPAKIDAPVIAPVTEEVLYEE